MSLWQRLKNVIGALWAVFDPKAQAKYAIRCGEMRLLARGAISEKPPCSHRKCIAGYLDDIATDLREHNGPAMAAVCEEGARLLRESDSSIRFEETERLVKRFQAVESELTRDVAKAFPFILRCHDNFANGTKPYTDSILEAVKKIR